MNDLNATVAELDELAGAYAKRWFANGPGHPHNARLHDLGEQFHLAADALRQAILIADYPQ